MVGPNHCQQVAARTHNAREAELNAREGALEGAQQQLEQQTRRLEVRVCVGGGGAAAAHVYVQDVLYL